ncbi:DUF2637 domain-containing protein [Planosporangium sp. 12N6]|uniref:DUF2637 domain-containing protein n=1 Tax=Planosporangium spinosum TaxID=3402278 RepID=UPI003CFA72B6
MTDMASVLVRASAMPVARLRRLRWAVRATLTLGVAASVAANILHAQPNPVSKVIAAWPPLALLLTVELISRVPVHRRALAGVRLAATATIASIAAWVSYWHMVGVAARYGETGPSPYLLPLSVDGLVIVASVSLVEIAGRIRAATDHDTAAPRTVDAVPATRGDSPVAPAPQVKESVFIQAQTPTGDGIDGSAAQETTRDDPDPARMRPQSARSVHGRATPRSPHDGDEPARAPQSQQTCSPAFDDEPVPSDTPAAVAYWYRRDPNLHPAEIGAKIGRSERTVRRYWPGPLRRGPATGNGEAVDQLAGTVRAR